MAESGYCIVKYDNLSLEIDPERPGHSRSYANPDVVAPQAFDKVYQTADECQVDVDKLMATGRGEEIDITLANGSHYKGPRYTYIVAEVTR